MKKYSLPIIQEVHAVKTTREIVNIIKAQRISEQVLVEVIKKLRVGVSEKMLARFIVDRFKKYDIKAIAFEPIVAFGKGSADIHHWPTNNRLKQNQVVMFDFGATINGYCSDMTRTFWFGEPTAKFKRVYSAVLTAQERALKLLIRGEKQTRVIDMAARKFLHRQFGKSKFTHGLGHGIGTAIHEWPNFKPSSKDVLPVGCVMTIEPGVYLSGWGGIRIEDIVVVKQQGIRNLTQAPKQLKDIILPIK